MAQQARDEAGNIWNIDEAGNPISLAQAAPQAGGGSVVAPNPVQAQRQQVGLTGDQLGNQKTAQQIALEAAQVPYAPRVAAAQATKAEAEAATAQLTAQKGQREAALPVSGQVGRQNLQRAIDDIRAMYQAGPGRTSGLSGLLDYAPTTANQQFDAAGNAVRGFVGPALGLTGGQLNTEKEAQRAVGPYVPNSWDRDAVIEDKIRRLQGLADAMGGARRDQQAQAQAPAVAATPSATRSTNARDYGVAGVNGGISGGPGGLGGGFSDAAGLLMAQKLSAAYNQGADVSALNRLLQDNGYQPLTDPDSIAAIQRRGPLNFTPPQVDDQRGAVGQALGSVADSPLGAYGIAAGDAVTAGTLDNIAGGQAKLAQEYAASQYPTASLLGTITGGTVASLGAELGAARAGLAGTRAALAGDAAYGAAYGAGSTDEGNRLLGAAAGGAGGALGGVAGRAAARGIGGALTGVRDANVQGLRAAGVPLTAGQVAGGAAKGIEDRLSGLPVLGDVVNARRREGFGGWNRAAFDEGLAPIGGTTGGVTGEAGIDIAQGQVSQGYRDALGPVSLTPDAQFGADVGAARAAGAAIPRTGPEFDYVVQQRLDPFMNGGAMTGEQFQDVLQGLRRADLGNDAMGSAANDALGNVAGAVRGLADRQAPGAAQALGQADQAFRRVEILRDAVNRARNGTRTGETGLMAPSQLADAAAANAKKYGNSQGTTRQPFFDLTRAGQAVLPNAIPDSGTAGRAVVAGGLGLAGIGGGAGYAADGGEGAGSGASAGLAAAALLAAGGSRAGQRALVAALADRPDALVQLGNQIQRRARIGGLFGAPLIAGSAPALVQ